MDSDLLRHVRNACKILLLHTASLDHRLSAAAHEFSVSLIEPGRWPQELLETAHALDNDLRANGDYTSTVVSLSDEDVRSLCERLLDLAIDVQVAVKLDMREKA